MLNIFADEVVEKPYPCVVSDSILPKSLFDQLKADFPDASTFETTATDTGSEGSRAGKGTGFDIYRGDTAYDQLIERSSAWNELDAWINSASFVDKYHELFGPYAKSIAISADIAASTYNRDYIEPRSVLKARRTSAEAVAEMAHKVTRGLRSNRSVELFTRLDITRSLGGYAKPPHCDRPNRLCSLIIYFTDAEDVGLEGGDLLLFKAKQETTMANAPRYPKPDAVECIAQLRPKENRGVFFPCCNNSYHGVVGVTSNNIPRDFLYINISGQVSSLW